jgi:transcription initiation factor TFIID subunit 13
MLFGFGDDKNPLKESVELLENIAFDYIKEMTKKLVELTDQKYKKINKEKEFLLKDFVFLIKKDKKKYAKIKYLLIMRKKLKEARTLMKLEDLC